MIVLRGSQIEASQLITSSYRNTHDCRISIDWRYGTCTILPPYETNVHGFAAAYEVTFDNCEDCYITNDSDYAIRIYCDNTQSGSSLRTIPAHTTGHHWNTDGGATDFYIEIAHPGVPMYCTLES